MKKEHKSDIQVAAEKAEAEWLKQRIISATNTIPSKLLNEGSYQAAVNFKNHAIQARKAAEAKQPTLPKLRSAWSLISGYYA